MKRDRTLQQSKTRSNAEEWTKNKLLLRRMHRRIAQLRSGPKRTWQSKMFVIFWIPSLSIAPGLCHHLLFCWGYRHPKSQGKRPVRRYLEKILNIEWSCLRKIQTLLLRLRCRCDDPGWQDARRLATLCPLTLQSLSRIAGNIHHGPARRSWGEVVAAINCYEVGGFGCCGDMITLCLKNIF